MTDTPETPPTAGPDLGPWIILGVPVLVEVLVVYLLIAVETPLSPWVHEVLERPAGMVLLAGVGLMAVLVVMFIVLSWAEWRHRAEERTKAGGGR